MTFGVQLSQVVNVALQAGVPAPEVILTLEMTKLELQLQILANAASKPSAAESPLIVPPNGRMPA